MWEEFVGYDYRSIEDALGGWQYDESQWGSPPAQTEFASIPKATFAPGVLDVFNRPALGTLDAVSNFQFGPVAVPASDQIRRPWPGLEIWPAATLPETVVTARRNPAPANYLGAAMYDDALIRIANGNVVPDGMWGVPANTESPYYGGLSSDYKSYFDASWGQELWRGALPAHITASPLLPTAVAPRLNLPAALNAASSWGAMLPMLAIGAVALFLIAKR